jgi:hypothetical protein
MQEHLFVWDGNQGFSDSCHHGTESMAFHCHVVVDLLKEKAACCTAAHAWCHASCIMSVNASLLL